jgi:hypothetical protein
MKVVVSAALISINLITATAMSEELDSSDPIAASFERMLNHEPPRNTIPQGGAIEQDVLYAVLNSIHWSSPEKLIEVLGTCQVEADDRADVKSEGQRSTYIARCITLATR